MRSISNSRYKRAIFFKENVPATDVGHLLTNNLL